MLGIKAIGWKEKRPDQLCFLIPRSLAAPSATTVQEMVPKAFFHAKKCNLWDLRLGLGLSAPQRLEQGWLWGTGDAPCQDAVILLLRESCHLFSSPSPGLLCSWCWAGVSQLALSPPVPAGPPAPTSIRGKGGRQRMLHGTTFWGAGSDHQVPHGAASEVSAAAMVQTQVS